MIFIRDFNEERAAARLAELLALEYGIRSSAASQIRAAAALHDVGKMKIPASILNKPGKLDAREFEVMKTHTKIGAEILSSITGELGVMARAVCLYHHERYDGGGYWGKRYDELPNYVHFTAMSDVFTALISSRPYKQPWPPTEALDYIQSQSGKQFSPALVSVFIPLVRSDSRVRALFEGV